MLTKTRANWIEAAVDMLVDGGIEAVRVEPPAVRLGVTKGSFYHHFVNRRALHEAMLDAWERHGTSEIIETVDASTSSPAERLRVLAHRTMSGAPEQDAIENAIRAWATSDPDAAAAITHVDDRRLEYTAKLLHGTGMSPTMARRRAKLLYRILIGEFVWRSSGGPTATHAEIDDALDLLLSPKMR